MKYIRGLGKKSKKTHAMGHRAPIFIFSYFLESYIASKKYHQCKYKSVKKIMAWNLSINVNVC